MAKSPYEVLGIDRNATDDEVKKAYRELAKQYHPDRYVDNPLANLAQEKFQEIQSAYDTIMTERQNGRSGSYQSYGSYGNTQGQNGSYSGYSYQGYNGTSSGSSQDRSAFASVRQLLSMGRFSEALNLLSRLPNQNAEWNYYMAISYQGLGRSLDALSYARDAVAMDPNNVEYRRLLSMLSAPSQAYRSAGESYGGMEAVDPCSLCMRLWCADSLCECLGADLCRCM